MNIDDQPAPPSPSIRTPTPAEVPSPWRKIEKKGERDDEADYIHRIATQTVPKSDQPIVENILKTEEADYITSIARTLPEKDQPIVENILKRVLAHPNILRWNNQWEVIINGITYPRSDLFKLLSFIMKKQTIKNDKGAPFGAKEFVDALLNDIKIPRDWIQATFIRTSKRKRGYSVSGGDGDDDEDNYEENKKTTTRPFKKKPKQMGRGATPWIIY